MAPADLLARHVRALPRRAMNGEPAAAVYSDEPPTEVVIQT